MLENFPENILKDFGEVKVQKIVEVETRPLEFSRNSSELEAIFGGF